MKPSIWIVLFLIQFAAVIAAAAAVSATQPSAPSPTGKPPVKISAEAVMATRFSLLTRRSMFVKGSQFVVDRTPGSLVSSTSQRDRERERSFRGAPTTAPAGSTTQPAESAVNVVFNGVIMVDGKAAAMVEDISALRVWTVQIGDSVAQGKVVGITLDSMDYKANGKIVHVEIGHNMQGSAAGPPSTQPTTSGPPSGGAGGGGDVLERMRKRRQQELGN